MEVCSPIPVWDKLRRKVGDVQGKLPAGAGTSIVNDDFGDVLGVFYGITADGHSWGEMEDEAKRLKNELLKVKDVAKVEIYGMQTPTIDVVVSPSVMTRSDLTIADIARAFAAQNKVIDAGGIETEDSRIRIESTGNFYSLDDIRSMTIVSGTGEYFRLSDIARVEESYKTPAGNIMRIGGKPALGVAVATVSTGNVVDMAAAVAEEIKRFEKTMPEGDIHNNRWYPGDDSDRLMDVVEFCAYMREQKKLLKAGLPNDFQDEYDQTWADKFPASPELANRKRIYVTVFVDEFYYDRHPISGEEDPQLWKKFVNCDNRVMFVLCDNKESLDHDSDATGSIITIRQRSIQTPYTLQKPELIRAWGTEQVDETAGSMRFYNRNENNNVKGGGMSGIAETTTDNNGLYNTAVIWDIVRDRSVVSGSRWDTYLEYDRENDSPNFFMVDEDDKAVGRYSCMMRNRDKDGDKEIDGDEVEWYLASINQIYGLFFGEQGLSPIASIYPESFKKAGTVVGGPFNENDGWRNHIVTSSVQRAPDGWFASPNQPQEVWAEEGLSVGFYKVVGNKYAVNTIRCVRNLGRYEVDDNPSSIADPSRNVPEELVSVTRDPGTVTPQTVYTFDCTNINTASLRFFTSRELEPMDEYSEMARLYGLFETGPYMASGMEYMDVSAPADLTAGYRGLLSSGGSPCPEGYRMPNLREAGLMYNLCNDNAWWANGSTHICNYYSLAPKDLKSDGTWNSSGSWSINNNLFTVATSQNGVRCVRDVRID